MLIDLHAHTTASDGLHGAAELVAMARARGIVVLALTDHDTAAGVRALAGVELPDGIEVVAGIEVTAQHAGREVHVLGYFIDPHHPRLLDFEQERQQLRRWRLERMVAQLQQAGIDIALEEVLALRGGGGAPGRPHVARVLVAKGYATGMRDCFTRLLLPGGPGYVGYRRPEVAQAVGLVRAAGGVPILAHPGLDGLEALLEELVQSGIAGVEAYHSAHDSGTAGRLAGWAQARGLLVTGGSDFHGLGLEEGGALGEAACPREQFERLRRWASSRGRVQAAGDAGSQPAGGVPPGPAAWPRGRDAAGTPG